MKFYSTVMSERASKGQGGNKYLRIALNVGSTKESRHIANLLTVAVDNGGYEIFFQDIEKDKTTCLKTGEIKGKKQKTATYKVQEGDCPFGCTEHKSL